MAIPGGPTPRSRLAAAACWLVLVLFLFPGVGSTLGRGLDSSWAYAVNALPFTDRLPGRDVVFPNGPLSWLFASADLGRHVLLTLLFWLGMHALFAVALGRVLLARRRADGFGALAFAAFWPVPCWVWTPSTGWCSPSACCSLRSWTTWRPASPGPRRSPPSSA